MRTIQALAGSRWPLPGATALLVGISLACPLSGSAQAPALGKHQDTGDSADAAKDLAGQVRELQVKMAKLEAALKQRHKGMPSGAPDTAGMGSTPKGMMGDQKMGMDGMDGDEMMQMMQMMGRMMQMMGGMQGNGMGAMGGNKPAMGMMDDDMMGGMGGQKPAMGKMDDMMSGMEDMDMMEMMGVMGIAPKSVGGMAGMKSMGKMQMKAALPNFPGASHIYHVGATDFFLNHPEHITLTPKQKGNLGRLKEKALLAKTSAQRKIDEAEQKLWILTSADEPDAAEIEAKIEEIEKLRGDQRMALIRAVGDAAKLLTDEQRETLLGAGADKTAKPDPHASHKP